MQYPIGYKSMIIIMFQIMMFKKNQNQYIIKKVIEMLKKIKIINYITIFWNYILINIYLNKEK
jgi:hypothetical protein